MTGKNKIATFTILLLLIPGCCALRAGITVYFSPEGGAEDAILESIPARTLVLHQGQIHYDGMWPP